MKRRGLKAFTALCAGLLLLAPVPGTAQQNEGETLYLTLSQALEIALSENPTIRIAQQEIMKQEYAKKGTYASLYPQIDVSGSYQRTIDKQTFYMDMGGESNAIKVGQRNTYAAGATAAMPLVSPMLWKNLQISALDVELAVEKARSSRIEMVEQVKNAFYTILLAGNAYDVFREAYDNALRNFRDIELKYSQGQVAEYDLIRADVNVKNAEPNMYDAENSLILGHWQLKALLGLDLELDIACVGELSDYENDMITGYLNNDLSLDRNSILRQFDLQEQQLEKMREMIKAQYYPTLNLQYSYQWISMNNNFNIGHYRWDPYSVVGLSLHIPVFAGGKRKSDVRQADVGLRQLTLQREDTERNLQLGIKQSVDRMSTCVKQYQAARAGVEQSEKGYAITMKRYETGEGTMLEINDSQLQLTQAQLNLNQSIYNFLIARSALEKTLGQSIE